MHTYICFLWRATLPTAHPNKAFENAAHAHCPLLSPHLLCNTVARLLPSSAQQQAQLCAGKAIPHSMITYLGLSHLRAFMQAPLGFFLISLISLQHSFSASCPRHTLPSSFSPSAVI